MQIPSLKKSSFEGLGLVLFALLASTLLCPSLARAQNSVITGTVADPSGAVIPGAAVKLHNIKTGVDQTAQTNPAGVYRIETVPGVYDISVEKAGFKVSKFTAITLTVEQIQTLNASLEVGSTTQTIEVNGQSVAPIDLENGQISNIVDQTRITELPLITRDPYSLAQMSPGIIETDADGGFSANGTRDRNNNFLLDGVDNNDSDVPGNPYGLNSLNPDSAQEFRVITNNFNAEYGRNNGAIIDVITKSGTNAIHGDAYWFGRYDVTGARDFFNHEPDTPKNPYIRNIFGASAGGPIRKDKTFWFVNYEGNRWITSLTDVSSVPNAAFRTGVFNAIDPVTGASVPIDVSTPTSPNNGIGFALDPTVQKILALYPFPNGPAIDSAEGYYFFPSPDRYRSDTFTGKIDDRIGQKNFLTGRYAFSFLTDPAIGDSNFLPPNLGGYGTTQRSQGLSFGWTSTLRSNLVNELKIGGNRTHDPFFCNGTSVFDSFGELDPYGRGADYGLSDPFGAGPSGFGCQVLGDLDMESRSTGTYQIIDSLAWVKGTHSMKFGWEGRDVYSNSYDDFGTRTALSFAPEYDFGAGVLQNISDPNVLDSPTLNDEVAMLLGFVSSQSQSQFFNKSSNRTADDLRGFRQKELAFYGQDAWKIRPNLTFNLGLRWEYYGVPYEVQNNFSNFFGNASGEAPFTFSIVGPGEAHGFWNSELNDFEPRVGFAWDPFKTGKTSVRGAFGLFHDRAYGNLFEDARGNPPFTETFGIYPEAPLTGLPAPPTVPTTPTVDDFNPATGLGGFTFPDLFDPNFQTPYSENWNFGIERQITDSLTIDVNYVGVRGLRLFRVVDGNPPQPNLVAALETYCKNPGNAYGCVDTPTESTLTGYALWVGNELGLLPFDAVNNTAFEDPSCTPGADLNKSIAESYYNGLQVNVIQGYRMACRSRQLIPGRMPMTALPTPWCPPPETVPFPATHSI